MSLWLAGGSSIIDLSQSISTRETQDAIQVDLRLPSDALLGSKQKLTETKDQSSAKQKEGSKAKINTLTSSVINDNPLNKQSAPKKAQHRHFGARELYKASQALLKSRARNIIAQDFSVNLPQGNEVQSKQIAISGRSNTSKPYLPQ